MPIWQIILLTIALLFAIISIGIWIWNLFIIKKLQKQQLKKKNKN